MIMLDSAQLVNLWRGRWRRLLQWPIGLNSRKYEAGPGGRITYAIDDHSRSCRHARGVQSTGPAKFGSTDTTETGGLEAANSIHEVMSKLLVLGRPVC